jgi:chemotaxis protein histidine kinase CheA
MNETDELVALAGDLVFERKRLSESLRRLETTLLHSEVAKELFRSIGVQKAETLNSELDVLARSIDRLGALAKTFVRILSADRMIDSDPLLADCMMTIESAAARLERPVLVDCRQNEVKLDREIIDRFRPVLYSILENFVEFCVEPPHEREARGKRPKAYVQLETRAMEDGYRLRAVCDGNGIPPPLGADFGRRLAELGVRATFEGKPGQWSAWIFHVPSGIGEFRCLPVRVGQRRLAIPLWAVTGTRHIEKGEKSQRRPGRIWAFGESLGRFEVDAGYESSYGTRLVELGAGTETAVFVVDEIFEPDEVFIKPLHPPFNGNGRFMGVVTTDSEELCLVLSPVYLVYGETALGHGTEPPPEKSSEGQHAL